MNNKICLPKTRGKKIKKQKQNKTENADAVNVLSKQSLNSSMVTLFSLPSEYNQDSNLPPSHVVIE